MTEFFAESAYTVYLIHPLIIAGLAAGFVEIYRAGDYGSGIEFDFDSSCCSVSDTPLVGPDNGGAVLCLGWLVVNILTHLIVWPLAWYVKKLPVLRDIL